MSTSSVFSSEEIARIKKMLQEGLTPEQIAEGLNIPRTSLRDRLKNSGYRIRTSRELEEIKPVGLAAETETRSTIELVAA